ncbi:MAG: glycosyltransferase family 39 protein [Candidatus Woesearchaeota archaeon]|jgi:hypothetical protein
MKEKEIYLVGIISFVYLFLMTCNVPFFLHDYNSISYLFVNEISKSQLEKGIEFAFRPFENIMYFLSYNLFGLSALPLRIFKAICGSLLISIIYALVKKETKNNLLSFICSIYILFLPPFIMSITLIYDFEIVCMFFIFVAYLLFSNKYNKEKINILHLGLFLIIMNLALLTKESAKIMVGVYLLTLFILNRNSIISYTIPFLILAILSIWPGILLGLNSSSSVGITTYLYSWFSWFQLVLYLKYALIYAGPIIVFAFISVGINNNKENPFKDNFFMIFFCVWALIATCLTVIIPMGEARYAIVPLIPTIIISFCIINNILKKEVKKLFLVFLLIFICVGMSINIGLDLKYRYGYDNFYTLITEAYEFIEDNSNNSLIIFTDDIVHYFTSPIHNNTYQRYDMTNLSLLGNFSSVYFISIKNPFEINEKSNSFLIKTLCKGPHCLMIYERRNETISSVPLVASSIDMFTYVFPNETKLDYCSIELNTKFLLPKKIKLIFVGDIENATFVFSPPVGKYKSCEYQCPVFANNETKIRAIEVTGSGSFLTKMYGGKVRYTS